LIHALKFPMAIVDYGLPLGKEDPKLTDLAFEVLQLLVAYDRYVKPCGESCVAEMLIHNGSFVEQLLEMCNEKHFDHDAKCCILLRTLLEDNEAFAVNVYRMCQHLDKEGQLQFNLYKFYNLEIVLTCDECKTALDFRKPRYCCMNCPAPKYYMLCSSCHKNRQQACSNPVEGGSEKIESKKEKEEKEEKEKKEKSQEKEKKENAIAAAPSVSSADLPDWDASSKSHQDSSTQAKPNASDHNPKAHPVSHKFRKLGRLRKQYDKPIYDKTVAMFEEYWGLDKKKKRT